MADLKQDLAALRIERAPERPGMSRWIVWAGALIVLAALGVAGFRWATRERPFEVQVATVSERAAGTQAAVLNASGYVTAGGAVVIGLAVGGLCYSATLLRARLKVDDALDVFAVHGVGGMLGALATGVLAVAAIGGVSGAIDGNIKQVGLQLVAVLATIGFSAIATFAIVKVVEVVLGLRVDSAAEEVGLDLAVHGEAAYQM